MLLNILISIIILYVFSYLFVFIDDRIDDLYYFIKEKLNKNKKNISYKTHDEFMRNLKNDLLRDKYLCVYRFFLHIKEAPQNFYLESKWFIQRGKRGYSDRDVWNLSYYISNILENSIKKLKRECHGFPTNLNTKTEWIKILEDIEYTFKIEKKINMTEVLYLPGKRRKKDIKVSKELEIKIMTKKECERYRRGWNLFRKHFRNLWD